MNRPAAPALAVRIVPVLFLALVCPCSFAAETGIRDAELLNAFPARPIGPANMGGRVTDLAVASDRTRTLYVGAASGGLWKSVDDGVSWAAVFDRQACLAIGAVAVAPSDPSTVWVGTGEANPRNSVSWGDGAYKSTDGGQTWAHVGLKETHHIGRIVIHPRDPETVYVAALGHLWGPNPERGIFKTTDGGRTWTRSHFLDEDTGFIDLVMDPGNAETLYAAAFQVRRGVFSGGNPVVQTGPGSGLYKTTDGGQSWVRLTRGLPDRPLGRCALDVARQDPRVLYAVIPTDKTAQNRDAEMGQEARAGTDIETGGIFRSEDGGETWQKVNDLCPRPFYFGQLRIDPSDARRVYVLGVTLHVSTDGGKSFRRGTVPGLHADLHALWIDPSRPNRLIAGSDGGISFSQDRGASWEQLQNLPIGQFYGISVDLRKPYRVYGGLQDNGSWGGPSSTRHRDGVTTADWARVAGGDGFYCQVDPADPDTVYAEGQYALFLKRINLRTKGEKDIRPRSPQDQPAHRFNWSSPLLLSPHNPKTLYYGGNFLFRSVDRGDHWQTISPDLTLGAPGRAADFGHTITTIAESPLRAGLLYVGTDDGRVHVSRDGGGTWTDVSAAVPNLPPERWISQIECSHFAEGTAYLTVDRHRNDDRRPYVFKTTNHGKTWRSIAGNLPATAPVHVIREDLRNKDLLFVGTEFGLFGSLDGGRSWHRIHNGLPAVPVYDLVIHPRERDLVVGTHGRSIYVLRVQPLEELTRDVRSSAVHLCEVPPASLFSYRPARAPESRKVYRTPNPPFGAPITYYLGAAFTAPVRIAITDRHDRLVAEFAGASEAGLHQVVWDLRSGAVGKPSGPLVEAGTYVVRLEFGEQVLTRPLQIEAEKESRPDTTR
jgi:photosystem II stability/assembly factor-like uncharacterized protein